MNKTSIHLNPDSIQIEVIRNGQRSLKNTTVQAIQEVLTRGERIETPLLPHGWGVQKYTKVNNREQYVIAVEPTIRKVQYDYRRDGGGIREYEIPTPGFVFIIHVEHNPANDSRRYIHGVAYAVKNQILSLSDRLYRFPFSNANDSYLCWGTERDFPELGGSKSIQTVPDRFLANPFNSDLDSEGFREFRDNVGGQEIRRFRTSHFFEYLDRKLKEDVAAGVTPVFKYDALRESLRLGEAIESASRQNLPR